jgi:hypothetical protein
MTCPTKDAGQVTEVAPHRTRRQIALLVLLIVVYGSVFALDLTHHRDLGGGLLVLATALFVTWQRVESRRTGDAAAVARQRDRDYYAARRTGASGPDAWIRSGLPPEGEPAEDQGDAGQPL